MSREQIFFVSLAFISAICTFSTIVVICLGVQYLERKIDKLNKPHDDN